MTQSLGLQRLTKVLGDQSRSTIRHQPGPIRQRCLFHTRSLTSRLDDLGEVSSTHGGLKSPGQDLPAKVIQDRDQIVPAPVLDQQIGRIRLPLLVNPGGLDPILRLSRKASELHLPWGPLWKQKGCLQDPVSFLGQDLIPAPSGSRGAIPEPR